MRKLSHFFGTTFAETAVHCKTYEIETVLSPVKNNWKNNWPLWKPKTGIHRTIGTDNFVASSRGGLLHFAAVVPCEQRTRKMEETSARRALKWSNGWKFCRVVLIWKIYELRMLGSGSIHNIHNTKYPCNCEIWRWNVNLFFTMRYQCLLSRDPVIFILCQNHWMIEKAISFVSVI